MVVCIQGALASPLLLHQYRRHGDEVVLNDELLRIDKFERFRPHFSFCRLSLSNRLCLSLEPLLVKIVKHWAHADSALMLLDELVASV